MTASSPRAHYALIPASYVFLRREDKVLLQHRSGTGYMDGHWVAGAAGHVEPGETAAHAAVREVAEELGVEVDVADLRLLTVLQRTDGSDTPIEQRIEWFWTVETWTGEPRIMEPHKCDGLGWYALDALPEPVPHYERFVLDGLRDGSLPIASAFGYPRDH